MGLARPYPRLPHLAPGPGIADGEDEVLGANDRTRLLTSVVRVEEKLDGANVSLWLDQGGWVQAAGRGGPGAMDRAGQLGRLRAWAAERTSMLGGLLHDELTLYAEWLWLRHGVAYDRLPDLLVGIDLRRRDGSFLPVRDRDDAFADVGLPGPPLVAEGTMGSVDAVDRLLAPSRFASGAQAEGVVLRLVEEERLLAKRVGPGFVQRSDESWAGPREHNAVAVVARRLTHRRLRGDAPTVE